MNIGIHANEFDGRGNGRVSYDYASGLLRRNHEVVFIASNCYQNIGASRLEDLGEIVYYDYEPKVSGNDDARQAISRIVERQKIDFLHILSYGNNNGIVPTNCRTGVHCVFDMSQPHGDVYAGVSPYLCRKFGRPETDCVPHIVSRLPPTEDWRKKYGIPREATVFGRHGGATEFNIPWVYDAISDALEKRDDLYFLFLSTDRFINHDRVFFIPWVEPDQEVANFIHACDAMLHARAMGETFGLAVGEFAAAGKPVLSYSPPLGAMAYDTAHLENYRNYIFPYASQTDLLSMLLVADRRFLELDDHECLGDRYGEAAVMAEYDRVFLNSAPRAVAPSAPIAIHTGDYLNDLFDKHGSDKGRRYHNYGRVYEHLLSKYRDQPISLLEIGVYEGASLRSWLEYFTHPKTMIVGVDLGGDYDPQDQRARVEHGDQADPDFLTKLADFHGPFDIIIDDGSHQSHHQQATFEHLWSSLQSGGVYIVEDLEVAYKPEFNDNDHVPTTEYFKAKATAEAIKVGQADFWVLFAGELIAIFKK